VLRVHWYTTSQESGSEWRQAREDDAASGYECRPRLGTSAAAATRRRRRIVVAIAAEQGLTLAHFRAQLEYLLDASLTLELNLSTFGTHPRVTLGYMGTRVSLS
jgi:hypothetical protein